MARSARNLLVLFGPPVLISWPVLKYYLAHATAGSSGRDAVIVSVLAHVVAAMLSLASLAMSVRLIWAAGGSLLLARTLLWLDVAAAWGVLCATATSAIARRLSFADATWSFSIIMCVVDLAAAAVLLFMIRRAERGNTRPKPWTLFA